MFGLEFKGALDFFEEDTGRRGSFYIVVQHELVPAPIRNPTDLIKGTKIRSLVQVRAQNAFHYSDASYWICWIGVFLVRRLQGQSYADAAIIMVIPKLCIRH